MDLRASKWWCQDLSMKPMVFTQAPLPATITSKRQKSLIRNLYRPGVLLNHPSSGVKRFFFLFQTYSPSTLYSDPLCDQVSLSLLSQLNGQMPLAVVTYHFKTAKGIPWQSSG